MLYTFKFRVGHWHFVSYMRGFQRTGNTLLRNMFMTQEAQGLEQAVTFNSKGAGRCHTEDRSKHCAPFTPPKPCNVAGKREGKGTRTPHTSKQGLASAAAALRVLSLVQRPLHHVVFRYGQFRCSGIATGSTAKGSQVLRLSVLQDKVAA